MTNLEIRNFAYDTIAEYLFENHEDFGRMVYDAVRQGGTIEHAVESFLIENYAEVGCVRKALWDIAMQWDGLTDERLKIFAWSCDIVVDTIGVEHLFNIEEICEFTNIRDNYTLGFITIEECANKIADKVCKCMRVPSIHTIDQVLEMVGLPRFHECVDMRTIYLTR